MSQICTCEYTNGDKTTTLMKECDVHWELVAREPEVKVTLAMLKLALMRARWDGPFDPQKAVDELNAALFQQKNPKASDRPRR